MKKVLFVISYLDKGGAERALSNITTHFPEDFEIEILVNNDNIIDYQYRGKIRSLQINEHPNTNSIFFQLKVLLKRVHRLRILKKKNQYDACVSFLDSANIANIFSGKKYCKTIVSVRSSLRKQSVLPQYKYIVNPLVKFFYNKADSIVAVSSGIAKELVEKFNLDKNKVVVIENGYDISNLINASKESLNKDEQHFFEKNHAIVTVGRLVEAKGQWHLIRAFSELLNTVDDATLVIVGCGELEEYLKNLVMQYGISDRVLFTGFRNNPYMYVKRAAVFVLPSLYEGFPNSLAEAVCLGIPCVATDFKTGAREILGATVDYQGEKSSDFVEEKYGILTPVCSGIMYRGEEPLEYQEQCLTKAILSLLQDGNKREEYAKRSNLRSKTLGIDRTIQEWIRVIDN